MPQAPLYAYLAFEDGQLRLCVSSYRLPPWGSRVIKGRSPPAVIDRFLDDGNEPLAALKAATAYFAGEEFGLDTPEFGETVQPRRKRRAKKSAPDIKIAQ